MHGLIGDTGVMGIFQILLKFSKPRKTDLFVDVCSQYHLLIPRLFLDQHQCFEPWKTETQRTGVTEILAMLLSRIDALAVVYLYSSSTEAEANVRQFPNNQSSNQPTGFFDSRPAFGLDPMGWPKSVPSLMCLDLVSGLWST